MSRRGSLPERRLEAATAGLMPFQRRTVAAVTEAMFERGQRRFLVADEVGLGKTKVARAVIAETIRRLWHDDGVDRIDVVYICSNSQIARQNLTDLDVLGMAPVHQADRITMLPAALAELGKTPVNLVAFTPHTSFTFAQARGRVEERAMLFHILAQKGALGRRFMARRGARDLLALGTQSFDGWLSYLQEIAIPRHVAAAYRGVLDRVGLIADIERLSDGRRRSSHQERTHLIGRLRRALAEACIELLSPDLIVLDEFQRFTSILDGTGDDGELAQMLFRHPDARVLLLSATPYRMLTRADDDEAHLDGFERTIAFLLDEARSGPTLTKLRADLGTLRAGLVGNRDLATLATARDDVEHTLRRVMVRTERLAATPDRDGMLDGGTNVRCAVEPADVASFVGTDRVTQALPQIPSIVEYWKSAPYLVNFMDEYKVKREVRAGWAAGNRNLVPALVGDHMLTWEELESYGRVESRHPRTRWLIEDLDRLGAFDRLWVPPALPQTELRGAYAGAESFTKRLIFSGWAVAPKAVAGLVSYEYERRHHRDDASYRGSRTSIGQRLALPVISGDADVAERFTTLALLLPSRTLAELGDPLGVAVESGLSLPVPLDAVRSHVRRRLESLLRSLLDRAPSEGRSRNVWYAVALAHLDPELLQLDPAEWRANDSRDSQGLADHLNLLRDVVHEPEYWGPPPEDLVDRLTDLALGSPAVAAMRSLARLGARFASQPDHSEELAAAARMAWGFRSFFGTPETEALIGARASTAARHYWLQIAEHCAEGGLGSVLDEWLHVVPDQLRLDRDAEQPLLRVADAVARVLHLRDGSLAADFFEAAEASGQPRMEQLRTHFAMRFGQARGAAAEGENPVDVRLAFNSPVRPFVLMSTSVGQEGLDFHHYSHAVVHWNLPSNPVDLEQREGRVHRYKNHAVRKNVAAQVLGDPRVAASRDPWTTAFELVADSEVADGGMRPWWVYPGHAAIQRMVPLLPMSADVGRLADLVKATTLYRMTMGQARQAELLEVLAELSPGEQEAVRAAVTVDLAPTDSPASQVARDSPVPPDDVGDEQGEVGRAPRGQPVMIASSAPDRAFLLTWNPARWKWPDEDLAEVLDVTASGGTIERRWSTGARSGGIEVGDRFYLLRQGRGPRGIIASGSFSSEVYAAAHWDGSGARAHHADVVFEVVANPDEPLPLALLQGRFPEQNWTPQGSGIQIRPQILSELATMWREFSEPI